jgi:hypothetical protein
MVQSSAYLASLAWLAWRGERLRGEDAFHLVVAYAFGVWVLSTLVNHTGLHQLPAIIVAGAAAYLIDSVWLKPSRHKKSMSAVVQVIIAASLALIVFDWITSHTPVALPINSVQSRNVALVCAAASWMWIAIDSRNRSNVMLRLGLKNQWAMEYWSRPLPAPSKAQKLIALSCWVAVLTIPMATTGLLSATILRDVAIAILVARVASTRGPVIVIAACTTLAMLRVGVGYAFVSNLGPPLVEGVVFVCLLLWLQYRSSRSAWGERVDR